MNVAGPPVAVALPESPAAVAVAIVVLLALTYGLLTVFIRVSLPPSREGETEDDAGDPRDPAYAQETVPPDEELFAPPAESADEPEPDAPADVPREPLAIETIRVGSGYVSLGDTASHTMGVFRTLVSESTPLVQRDPAGKASYVARSYRIGRRTVSLVLERERSEDPLRLVRIEVAA